MAVPPSHSNLYCRGYPPDFGEADLLQLFGGHGEITSLRMVAAGDQAGQTSAAPHAFVKYAQPEQAAAAIQGLNGIAIGNSQLVVKFADADVQPRVESGRQPSEWCYCRNLPANYTRQDIGEMFVPFGTVLEIRLFPSTELYKGSGALVQMQSVEQASAAIHALNGSFPRGAQQPLLVRYADSPAEKAAKQARKERLLQKQVGGPGLFAGGNLLTAQLQQQLLGLAIGGGGGRQLPLAGTALSSPDLQADLPAMLLDGYQDGSGGLGASAGGMLQQQAMGGGGGAAGSGGGGASIYIKGMPEDADKLWLYEKFARFGGIASVRVLIDEGSGKCNGIGFVNYTTAEAARLAQEAMNGVSMGERLLHVMVQNPAARSRAAAPAGLPISPGRTPAVGSSAVHAAAASLGVSAGALASLQAGLMPSAAGGMGLHGAPAGLHMPMQGHPGAYGGSQQQAGVSFGQLQW